MEEKIPIANEMTSSQRPAIEVLQKLGYKYISDYNFSHFAIKLIEITNKRLQYITFIPTFAAK